MSIDIDDAFVKQFERDVHEAYQRKGSKVRMMTRSKSNVKGSSTTFQTVGKGAATTKGRNSEITPMNIDHTPKECTLADYYAGDWVDKLDTDKINHDERRVVVNAGAYALGRTTDSLIITAMDGTSTTEETATAMTLSKIQTSMKTLGDNDVFEDGRMYAIVPWTEWSSDLLSIQQFASADYSGENKPFLSGTEARSWLGTTWMPHGGLETLLSGSVSKSFWFHEDSVGCASGTDVTSDITWHGDRAAWFVNNMMSMGAVLIDGNGCLEIQCTRS